MKQRNPQARMDGRTLDSFAAGGRDYRRLAEALREEWDASLKPRLHLLDPADALLLRLFHDNHLTYEQIGQLRNQNRGTIYKRLNLLRARLRSPFADVLSRDTIGLPTHLRQLGIERFVRGTSTAELARRAGVSVYRMTQQLQLIRGWVLSAIKDEVKARNARNLREK